MGSQKAFTTLLDIYWTEVYHFILKRTENETDAEDITIETFAKAFDKITSYKTEFQFNTWLITIAKNVHIDLIRKRKSNQFINLNEEEAFLFDILEDDDSLEDQLIYEQNLATLKHCIKQLKPHYQQIIQLRYFQERTYNEIAEIIHEPLNNVKIKILRAKKLLTELIKKQKTGL
ncbi:RNA polymerase sigma factor [Paenimyroides aestuarii]|uniref:RNA polymerase sigma factor n=1 Tax=Paenimyroides aestuarii TaxID=2968490 RepID=A0ABY5NW54_9FLAO|nr:RNA polymerase sigma factor [Paenimyroides aestuarii]UUV22853.1 RNA polymerase sigma factor [Paenimyroides aestuarii]